MKPETRVEAASRRLKDKWHKAAQAVQPVNRFNHRLESLLHTSGLHMRSRSAFSLVEIVIAIGLVSFSLLAIFALVVQGHKTSRESRLESVAALLAGKVNSQLRASAAWDISITNYTGSKTLSDIAAGQAVTLTNYYDLNLENVPSTDPDRQFALVTEVSPVIPARLVSSNIDVTAAISRLPSAANTVLLNVTISYPALAPDANRSKRYFSSIITRTSTK
jgi:type II secretory pathway pseudopilin PulG